MADQAQKDRFIEALTELGGSAGNGRLREALQWDEATYNAAKEDLVAEGAITQGRGRGGSVFVGDVAEGEAQETAAVVTSTKSRSSWANFVCPCRAAWAATCIAIA
jgi:type I restriction enzyme M protein